MKCPECHKQLGEWHNVDSYTIGWVCTECGIKIYKDLRENVKSKANQ